MSLEKVPRTFSLAMTTAMQLLNLETIKLKK